MVQKRSANTAPTRTSRPTHRRETSPIRKRAKSKGKKRATHSKGGQPKGGKSGDKHEQEMAALFQRSKLRLQMLWEELHIPRREREIFAHSFFYPATPVNHTHISTQIARLLAHRSGTLAVLKAIEVREAHCHRLRMLTREDAGLNAEDTRREILATLAAIQEASVEAVEDILTWRRALSLPKPFLWEASNYLLKMESDLEWIDQHPAVSSHIPHIQAIHNPLLLENRSDGRNAHNSLSQLDVRRLLAAESVIVEEERLQERVLLQQQQIQEVGHFVPTLRHVVTEPNPQGGSAAPPVTPAKVAVSPTPSPAASPAGGAESEVVEDHRRPYAGSYDDDYHSGGTYPSDSDASHSLSPNERRTSASESPTALQKRPSFHDDLPVEAENETAAEEGCMVGSNSHAEDVRGPTPKVEEPGMANAQPPLSEEQAPVTDAESTDFDDDDEKDLSRRVEEQEEHRRQMEQAENEQKLREEEAKEKEALERELEVEAALKRKQAAKQRQEEEEEAARKREAAQAEAERLRIEREEVEAERLRIEREQAEAERLRIEQEQAEAERLRMEKEQAEAERLRMEREEAEAERLRIEQEQAEAERLRIEQEQAEAEAEAEEQRRAAESEAYAEEEFESEIDELIPSPSAQANMAAPQSPIDDLSLPEDDIHVPDDGSSDYGSVPDEDDLEAPPNDSQENYDDDFEF
jgi:hypothetical protein